MWRFSIFWILGPVFKGRLSGLWPQLVAVLTNVNNSWTTTCWLRGNRRIIQWVIRSKKLAIVDLSRWCIAIMLLLLPQAGLDWDGLSEYTNCLDKTRGWVERTTVQWRLKMFIKQFIYFSFIVKSADLQFWFFESWIIERVWVNPGQIVIIYWPDTPWVIRCVYGPVSAIELSPRKFKNSNVAQPSSSSLLYSVS